MDLEARRKRLERLRQAVPKHLSRFERAPGQLEPPPPSPPPAPPSTLEEALPSGAAMQNDLGVYFLVAETFGADHAHGDELPARLAGRGLARAAVFAEEPRLAGLRAEDCVFLDTETTGLAQGAGTLVFMVGVGWLTGAGVEVQQYFLRDPGEEPAMLAALDAAMQDKRALVTFNGRGFDVPLLQNRFILNRLPPRWTALPHLDLLAVARQLWRDHLPSRRLGELETHILGVTRAETDIDSALIPEMYVNYLRTGATGDMARIFYHNLVDVLSLVTLLAHTARMVTTPEQRELAAGEWAGMGRVYDRAGRAADALAAWERALCGDAGDLDPACAARLWREIGARHRRAGAWDAACAAW
ncbi:MAG: ribonuclease H-like domain-containing protein, partial [Anaerolineae bacterium]|nr:ribonuclease H-like domain-containing protein [Anaerolineae bacterium]